MWLHVYLLIILSVNLMHVTLLPFSDNPCFICQKLYVYIEPIHKFDGKFNLGVQYHER